MAVSCVIKSLSGEESRGVLNDLFWVRPFWEWRAGR